METVLTPIHQKEQFRSQQRDELLAPLSPQTREFLTFFIPSEGKTDPFEEGFDHNIKRLTSEFGEDTHILVFGLAATAKSPQELHNIFITLSSLGKVKWDQEKSIKKFVKSLTNPTQTHITQETHAIANQFLNIKDEEFIVQALFDRGILDFGKKRQYLLEAFFDILTSPSNVVSNTRKEKMLKHLDNNRSIFLQNGQKTIFDSDVSFWKEVDRNWLFSPEEKISEKEREFADDPFPGLTKENQSLRRLLEDSIKRNQDLENTVGKKDAKIEELRRDIHDNIELIGALAERLRRKKLEGNTVEITKTIKPDIFQILGLTRNATFKEVRDKFRKRALVIHPDLLEDKLEKSGVFTPEEIQELLKATGQDIRDLNEAYQAYYADTQKDAEVTQPEPSV